MAAALSQQSEELASVLLLLMVAVTGAGCWGGLAAVEGMGAGVFLLRVRRSNSAAASDRMAALSRGKEENRSVFYLTCCLGV